MDKTFLLTRDVMMGNGKIKTFSDSYKDENTARIAYLIKDGRPVIHIRLSCINPDERTVTILAEKSR